MASLLLLIIFTFSLLFLVKERQTLFYLTLGVSNFISLYFVNLLCTNFNWITSEIDLTGKTTSTVFVIDTVNLPFILLTLYLFPLCYLYSYYKIKLHYINYIRLLWLTYLLLILVFSVKNFLSFYIFFELLLLPLVFLIGVWGSRGRKIHAFMQFFLFTFVSSIFVIAAIILIFLETGTLNFNEFEFIKLNETTQYCVALLIFFGFLAKIPAFPVHIWLPEAHVEAPTVGSVLLAAVILKLAFYGFVRTLTVFISFPILIELRSLFLIILIVSMLYSSFVVIRQIDLKKIVAYSSIVHMNMALIGLFMNDSFGYLSSFYSMYSHGLISAALFFVVGMLYDRYHTRNILYFSGLVYTMPLLAGFFFFFVLANMGLPGLCGFVGELFLFISSGKFSIVLCILINIGVIFVSIFSLILLFRVFFYQLSPFLKNDMQVDVNVFETFVCGSLACHIIFFGIFPELIFSLFAI